MYERQRPAHTDICAAECVCPKTERYTKGNRWATFLPQLCFSLAAPQPPFARPEDTRSSLLARTQITKLEFWEQCRKFVLMCHLPDCTPEPGSPISSTNPTQHKTVKGWERPQCSFCCSVPIPEQQRGDACEKTVLSTRAWAADRDAQK